MNTLTLTSKNNYLIITLDRGSSNAINHEMVKELRQTIKTTQTNEEIAGVILNGTSNFFSAGLDVIELYDYDESQMKAFWDDFSALVRELTWFPKPLVAAITGHSPAGGCVFAICCDYRVMAKGAFRIGLNEHQVGIVVPDSIFELYAFWLGKGKAYQYLLEAKLLTPEEALNVGLVDELTEPQHTLARAEEKLESYLALEQTAWQKSKANLRKTLSTSPDAESKTTQMLLEQWWSPQGRATLKLVVGMLKARKR